MSKCCKAFRVGSGNTWPGEIALRIDPNILQKLLLKIEKKVIIVAGTNGKTTTSLMITKMLTDQGFSVLHNASGANLLNGIVSSFFSYNRKTYDYAVFEVDENALPSVMLNVQCQMLNEEKRIVLLLNLFRDQLDRYGEVDTIAKNWLEALKKLDNTATVLINGDDPQLAYIGAALKTQISYFGLSDKNLYLPKMQHATDSIFCPKCGNRLVYTGVYFSHLGDWVCNTCGFTHPSVAISSSDIVSPMEGTYNTYNTMAATLVGKTLKLQTIAIEKSLSSFTPAFGRMEEVAYQGKSIKILLSKNPTGFNESLRTMLASKNKGPLLLLLNDRIPDGTDVSWIWDVDMEQLNGYTYPIVISGDRYLDMALRIKYALNNSKFKNQNSKVQVKSQNIVIEKNLQKSVDVFTETIQNKETGWVLATYSAMLDVRKILTGRKIL